MISDAKARIGAVACTGIAIAAFGVFAEQVHAAAVAGESVNQEAIVVSLPVFVASIGGAMGFTWIVAQWDAKRTRRLKNLERQLIQRGLVKPDEEE